jgi:hypothetical protein
LLYFSVIYRAGCRGERARPEPRDLSWPGEPAYPSPQLSDFVIAEFNEPGIYLRRGHDHHRSLGPKPWWKGAIARNPKEIACWLSLPPACRHLVTTIYRDARHKSLKLWHVEPVFLCLLAHPVWSKIPNALKRLGFRSRNSIAQLLSETSEHVQSGLRPWNPKRALHFSLDNDSGIPSIMEI